MHPSPDPASKEATAQGLDTTKIVNNIDIKDEKGEKYIFFYVFAEKPYLIESIFITLSCVNRIFFTDSMKHYDIDPDKLVQVFDTSTASYKFFWLRALLKCVRQGKAYAPIPFHTMVAAMVGMAWRPLTSGLFSFGKCDALVKRIYTLIFNSELNTRDLEERVQSYMEQNTHLEVVAEVVEAMTVYVPYRFLYPWLGAKMTNKQTAIASQDFEHNRCPYAIKGKTIQINPAWIEYLTDHIDILEGFAQWRFQQFLLKRNPKLVLPQEDTIPITADGMKVVCPVLTTPQQSSMDEMIRKIKKYEALIRKMAGCLPMQGTAKRSTTKPLVEINIDKNSGVSVVAESAEVKSHYHDGSIGIGHIEHVGEVKGKDKN